MPKYLFEGNNAVWNSTTKSYEYSLTSRLRKPTSLRIESVRYVPATLNAYPQVIYMRSKHLGGQIKDKHTVEVIGNSDTHDRNTDILGVLEESHQVARYQLREKRAFRFVQHAHVSKIDFYFTDPVGNLLQGPYDVPTVDTWSELKTCYETNRVSLIFDADHAGSFVKEGGGDANTEGDLVYQYKARLPDDDSIVLTRSSENGIQLKRTINTKTWGITTASGGSSEYMFDTAIGFNALSQSCFFILWETDNSLPTLENILKIPSRVDLVLYNGSLQIRDSSNNYTQVIQNIQASTPYIIEVQWHITSGVGEYTVNLTKLSENGNTEYSNTVSGITPPSGSARNLYIGTAQTTLDSLYSSMVMCRNNADPRSKSKQWLIAKWKGETISLDPNGQDASRTQCITFREAGQSHLRA